MAKQFKLTADQIVRIISPMGGCIAIDKIVVDGELVDYMYLETSELDKVSGWRFFSRYGRPGLS